MRSRLIVLVAIVIVIILVLAIPFYIIKARNDAKKAPLYFNIGLDCMKARDWTRAVTAHKKALRLNPRYAEAHYQLALAYHHLGEPEKALAEYNVLKELDKDLAEQLFAIINQSSKIK